MNVMKDSNSSHRHARSKVVASKIWNSLFFQIFLYFAIILTVFAVLLGVIFMNLYRQNTLATYEEQLESQGLQLANNISTYANNDDVSHYTAYILSWQEMLLTENTDLWVISNPKAKEPLKRDFSNVTLDNMSISEDMQSVISKACDGGTSSSTSYDELYRKHILRLATPIHNASGDVIGVVLLNTYVENQDKVNNSSLRLILSSSLVSLLVSFIIAIAFARSLARPISQMRIAAAQYAMGNYDYTTGIYRRDEIGELATTLDILSDKLTQSEIERQNLEQMRRDFFANVSHELRTPITVIRGYTETLYDGMVPDPEKAHRYYERMLQECHSMERLVSDLLTLSKMQNPQFAIELEPVNLVQVFKDSIRSVKVIAAKKGIALDFHKSQECIMMPGDYQRLRQMFRVIIDNAIKFSSENSVIHLSVEEQEDSIFVSIRDEGIGISPEELPHIFDKFYKSKLRQNATGSGLGLMIAKEIANRHDGTIAVFSKAGEGTDFQFTFPRQEDDWLPED